MRVYSQPKEENVRDQELVRDWVSSGLLKPEQDAALQRELTADLRQTHDVLRAVLFLFTLLILIASVGLSLTFFDFSLQGLRRSWEAGVFALWAATSFGVAWLLASKGRLYRCGVEEALATASVGLVMLSVAWGNWAFDDVLALAAGALGSFAVYSLFGFRYAMVAAVAFAGMIPFGLSLAWSAVIERVLSALIFGFLFYHSRTLHLRDRNEITGKDWAVAQVTAFVGLYLVLNLMITGRSFPGYPAPTSGVFYWCTYALVWVIPPVGLWLGIREKDRLMINTSSVAALATLVSNKPYLGWTRHTWDPILLGALLIGTALALRKWLAKGREGERHGFTAERLLASDDRALTAAGAISLALPHAPGPGSKELPRVQPGGGKSGGGGASGSF